MKSWFKCFLVEEKTGVVFGVVSENVKTVSMQRMRLNSFGGLSPAHCPPIYEPKQVLTGVGFLSVKKEVDAMKISSDISEIKHLL